MADLTKGFKGIWLKSMEAIGDAASKVAANTKYKVSEMNLVNRRKEILTDFGAKSYELWQKGENFPAELDVLLAELHQLETELGEMRTEKEKAAAAAKVVPVAVVKEEPAKEVSLEEKTEEAMDKVEDALDTIGDAVEEVVDDLKEAIGIKDDDEESDETEEVPVIEVEDEPKEEAPCAEEEKPAEEVPVIEVEE